jgi:mannose/fructose/N-acetylgalactosamine-specific phosphotransferase system component IIC
LGAIGAAVIDQMLTGMGRVWTFFFLGFCMAIAMGLLWVEWVYGMRWRHTQLDGIERKKAERDAQADTEAQVGVKNDPGQDVNVEVNERDK